MSDAQFSGEFVPNTYGDRVQRCAVLYPMFGVLRTPEQVTVATFKLLQAWRTTVTRLTQAGWVPPSAGDGDLTRAVQYLRNCRPTFVKCRPATRMCFLRHTCPFCYARRVREIWEQVDLAFPNPRSPDPPSSVIMFGSAENPTRAVTMPAADAEHRTAADFPYWLIERRNELNLPFWDGAVYQQAADMARLPRSVAEIAAGVKRAPPSLNKTERQQFLSEFGKACDQDFGRFGSRLSYELSQLLQYRQNLQRCTQSLGMLALTMVEPRDTHWHVEQRQLFMVTPGTDYTQLLSETRGKLVTHQQPTRKVLFEAVARTCAYPPKLLFSNPALLATLLLARKDFRLFATTGRLRNTADTRENRRRRNDS
jgi:hypothetical protein